MYRHHQHLMEEDTWDRKPKKPSECPGKKPPESQPHQKNSQTQLNSPAATVPEARNPLLADDTPENAVPETKPPAPMKGAQITEEQNEKKPLTKQKTEKLDIFESRRSPVKKGAKTRKRRKHKWILLIAGFITSMISGVTTYTWLERQDNIKFTSSLERVSEDFAKAPQLDRYIISTIEDTDLSADDVMDQEDHPEYLNEGTMTGALEADEDIVADEDDNEFAAIMSADTLEMEIAGNDPIPAIHEPDNTAFDEDNKADAVDVTSGTKEALTVVSTNAESDSRDMAAQRHLKENTALTMKQPPAQSNEQTASADENDSMIKEKPLVSAEPESDAPVRSLQKDKIDQLAQILASSNSDTPETRIDLTDTIQPGNENEVVDDTSYLFTESSGPAPGELVSEIQKLHGTGDTNEVSVSNKFLEKEQKDISVQNQNVEQLLQAEVPALIISESAIHKPMQAALLISSLPGRQSVSLQIAHEDEQADTHHKGEKQALEATPAIVKKSIQQAGLGHKGSVLLAQHKESVPVTDAYNFQPVKTVALKEMSVTYEDEFNDHANNWPEYNNDKASVLIEEGEYRLEHKAQSGSHIVLHPYGVPNNMNYVIHAVISSVRGSGKNAYGFVLGGKDTDNNYSFQIHSDNSYTVKKRNGGYEEELVGGHIDNVFIGQSSGTTLKVVKLNNKVRFYLDGYYIDELLNVEFPGDKVGFLVEGKIRIAVDATRTEIKFSSN